ncbi:MAG: HNH endonuclease [Nitrospirae bacterium]|nr:HNH endonuclease [Candidatus Manganitrophaceae bacterium]
MKLSRFLNRSIQFIVLGLIWISISPAFVIGAPSDPAPIPDEVVQKIVTEPRTHRINPLPEVLRHHLDEASDLLKQIEKIDQEGGDPNKQEVSHESKRVLLQSKVQELNAIRKEVRDQFSERRAKLISLGLSDKARSWDGLLKQIEDRFDRMNRALEGVRISKDKGQRGNALARAKSEIREIHEKGRERQVPPENLEPTIRQEKVLPLPSASASIGAPPPQYASSMSFPENIYADQYAFWGKTLLVSNPPATPPDAITNCSYTNEDLLTNSQAGSEVQVTPEIQALAESLAYSPVKIYQYVSNNIKFEPYYGSLKGAMGALVSGGGSSTDQASLLIALLRVSNIPARYVKGEIVLNDDRGLRWVGAKSYDAAYSILAVGGIPISSATSTEVRFIHVWVEACVPYSNYRGAGTDITGSRWIPLDPSFKDKTYQAGIATNVSFDYSSYMASRTQTLPYEKYQEQVEAQIKTIGPNFSNNTIQDVGYIGTQNPSNIDILPASLPYKVQSFSTWTQGGGSETAKVPDSHRYKFNIIPMNAYESPISDTVTLLMPDVVLKRITLSFKPATSADQAAWDNTWDKDFLGAMPNIDVVSVVKVEGVDQDTGAHTSVKLGDFTKLKLSITLEEFRNTSQVNYVTYTNIRAGGYHALQGYAFQASDRLLKERSAQLLNAVRTTPDDKDATVGEFLHLSGLKYMRHFADAIHIVAEIDGGSGQSGNHIGLTSSDLKVQYLFDIPYAIYPGELVVDVIGGQSRNVDITSGSGVWKTFLLSGYAASAYEHYIWQENARLDAISAVKGIQIARENNIEVLTLTSANWGAGDQSCKLNNSCSNTALNTNPTGLNYSTGAISSIKGRIDNGYTVTIPRQLFQYQNWTGYVYIRENQALSAAGFSIDGSYNGGYTVGPPVSVTGGSAPIYNSDSTAPSTVSNNSTTFTNSTTASNGINSNTTISGDPVNMVTGNMYHNERDIFIKRRGLPLVFERNYNSRNPVDGPLGFGWTHSFNHYLKFIENSGGFYKVSWTDGSGGEKFFKVPVSGSTIPTLSIFTNPSGVFVDFRRAANGTYTIREKNGLTYTFENLDGSVIGQKPKLLNIKDQNGNTLTLGYTNGLLSSVTDDLGASLIFFYTGSRIYQVKYGSSTHQYEYDGAGNLATYKNPLALAGTQSPLTYTYYSDSQLNHALKTYNLPKGNGMTFEYYMNGKVFKHYNTLGETTTFTYNEFRRETVSVNERGFTRRFFFDDKGNPVKIIEENGAERIYTYDSSMNRITSRDPMGNTTQYAYDATGNVTTITNPSGSTIQYSYFNAFNRPGKIKDANGNYTLLKYDSNGNVLQRIALKNGIGASIDPTTYTPVSSDVVAWTITTYNTWGYPSTVKQVRNFATQVGPTQEYQYYEGNFLVLKITRRGDKNGDGIISSGEFDESNNLNYDYFGRVKFGLRGDWYPTQFNYDAVGRVIQGSDVVGQLRDYTYDANGNPTGEILTVNVNGVPTRVDQAAAIFDFSDRKIIGIGAGGGVSAFQYDMAGNLVKITNPDGYTLGFDYDPNNRVIKAYNELGHAVTRTLDLDGKPRSITDPNGNTIKYEYYGPERDGRLKKQIDSLNHTTQFDYDANGNVTVVTDPLNRTTTTSYGELNRPVRIVGPVFTDPTLGQIRPVTRYTYDNLGNLLTISAGRTDNTGNSPNNDVVTLQMSYTYDDFGRKLKETDPLGRSRTFTYDMYGNPETITDAKQQTTRYAYDYGHQLSEVAVDPYSDPAIRYIRNQLGQIVRIEHPDGDLSYSFNSAHRLSQVIDRRGNKSLGYEYSPGGLLNRMKDSDGNYTDYLYNPIGRLSGVWAPNGDLVSYVYDPGGRLTEKWFPNGVNTRYTYNSDNTLKQLINRSQSSTIISQHDYTYDAVGNRLTQNETIGATTTPYKYVYDELSRLTETRNNSTNALIEGYTYDVLGNRRTKTDGADTKVYIYNAANQLTEIHQGSDTGALLASLVYDLNGSLVTKTEGATTTSLTYDVFDRLTQVNKTGIATQNYAYDANGRRIKKVVGSSVTQYLYNGPDIVAEYGATWTSAQATYAHGPNMDDPIIRATSTTTQYYHQDGLGNVVAVSDPTGATTGQARYDAWGNTLSITGAIPQYGYTGREPDETGLIYYRGRYYDPSIGRFTQRDPIGLSGGVNPYTYVKNNPINFTDPWGLSPQSPAQTMTAVSETSYYQSSVSSIAVMGMTSASQSLADLAPSLSIPELPTMVEVGAVALEGIQTIAGAAAAFITAPVTVGVAIVGGSIFYPSTPNNGEDMIPTTHFTEGGTGGPKAGSSGGPGSSQRFPESIKDQARQESDNRCVFCGVETTREPGPNQSNIDHADPASRGGNNTVDNAQNTCRTCNLDKRTSTTEEYLKRRK